MLYFIPAWYQKNEWKENEQNWYMRRMHTEFDDTVKQIQLFHRSKAYPYQIMLLSYAPNFRHFGKLYCVYNGVVKRYANFKHNNCQNAYSNRNAPMAIGVN